MLYLYWFCCHKINKKYLMDRICICITFYEKSPNPNLRFFTSILNYNLDIFLWIEVHTNLSSIMVAPILLLVIHYQFHEPLTSSAVLLDNINSNTIFNVYISLILSNLTNSIHSFAIKCCLFHDVPSGLEYKPQFRRQLNCWSLRCSWSIACWHCSNYIFNLNLTPGFNGLG